MTVEVNEDFDGFGKAYRQAMYESLDIAGVIAQGNIKGLLGKHGVAGGVAKAFGITSKARSSEPGQPPGLRTGHLQGSIQIDRAENKGLKPTVTVGTNLIYARVHELGNSTHPRRPFIAPGASMSETSISKATAAIFRQVLKKFRGVR
jgi:hypothetical protein